MTNNEELYKIVTLRSNGGPMLATNGKGYWSDEARNVKVTCIEARIQAWPDGDDYMWVGELRVFFHKSSWNVDKHGLIYTDTKFLKGLRKYLKDNYGIATSAVGYSEQGMQGNDYVSLDLGTAATKKIAKKVGMV